MWMQNANTEQLRHLFLHICILNTIYYNLLLLLLKFEHFTDRLATQLHMPVALAAFVATHNFVFKLLFTHSYQLHYH